MLRDSVTIDQTIDFLNSLLVIDVKAMTNLIAGHVECNRQFADHPTVQVDNKPSVGLLGILNGLFGTLATGEREGYGPITAVLHGGVIIRFERTLEE